MRPPFAPPREAALPAEVRRIAEFRTRAWLMDGTITPDQVVDGILSIEDDGTSRHWIVEHDGGIVAAIRLSVHATVAGIAGAEGWLEAKGPLPGPLAHFTRMVVHPAARQHGLGGTLLDTLILEARRLRLATAVGLPQSGKENLLAARGFVLHAREAPGVVHPPYTPSAEGLLVMKLPLGPYVPIT